MKHHGCIYKTSSNFQKKKKKCAILPKILLNNWKTCIVEMLNKISNLEKHVSAPLWS